MRFQSALKVTHGVFGVDPIAAPQTVPPVDILSVPSSDGNGNPMRLAVVLEAAAAEGATISIYAADESTLPNPNIEYPDTAAVLLARRFYLVKSGQVLVGGTVVTIPGPLAGSFYVRMTADTLVAGATLRFAAVPAGLVAT